MLGANYLGRQYPGQTYQSYAGGVTHYTLTADTRSYTLSGVVTGLRAARVLTLVLATYTETGNSAGLVVARKLPATVRHYAVTGNATSLVAARKLTATLGTFVETGNAAVLKVDRKLPASTRAYTLAGLDIALRADRVIRGTVSPYVITGNDVILTYTPSEVVTSLKIRNGDFIGNNNSGLQRVRRSIYK